MTQTTEQGTPDIREYLGILRRRKASILLVTVVVLGLVVAYTFHQTPLYQGDTRVVVNSGAASTNSNHNTVNTALNTEVQLLRSPTVAQGVISRAKLRTTAPILLKHLTVTVLPETQVLDIRYEDPSRLTAATMSNAFANAYVSLKLSQRIQSLTRAAQDLTSQMNVVNGQLKVVQGKLTAAQSKLTSLQIRIVNATTIKDTATANALRAQAGPIQTQVNILQGQSNQLFAQLTTLQQHQSDLTSTKDAASSSPPASVVQKSAIPTSPITPQKKRNVVLGLLAGLVLGVGVAFLRERLDDRLKSRQELERRLGAPVIAVIPRISGWRRESDAQLVMRSDPKSPISEAYRTLGTNIQYLSTRQPLNVLMVTSSLGGEGKTTTSANLAVALAHAGRRVIVVSADVRKPRLHNFFGMTNEVGVTDVLSDSADAGILADVARDPGILSLRVVTGGRVPQDPAALLGSPKAGEFLDWLRAVADFIIIDTPPVLAVADASILAPLVDGTLLVVDTETTRRSALQHARDQLANAGATLVGAVYNKFDPRATTSYPYYYHYYYESYYGEDGTGDEAKNGRRWPLRKRASMSERSAETIEPGPDAPTRAPERVSR